MKIHNKRDTTKAFVTKDGSTIRELMHPAHHANRHQSLAEARVPPGTVTRLHKHPRSEELYYFLQGQGRMTLASESFPVAAGDVICITPGTPHQVENTGTKELVFLCCCVPPYSDQDTVLL